MSGIGVTISTYDIRFNSPIVPSTVMPELERVENKEVNFSLNPCIMHQGPIKYCRFYLLSNRIQGDRW